MQSIPSRLPPTDALVWGLVSAFIVAVVIGWLVVTPFNRLLRRRVPWVKEENLGKGVPSWFTGMLRLRRICHRLPVPHCSHGHEAKMALG